MTPPSTDTIESRFPIEKLSPKLLSAVFAHCIPVLGQEPCTLSKRRAPLSIASVCRKWREFVLQDASLWAFFEVKAIKTSRDWVMPLLLHLKRSRDHPLSFRVEFDYEPGAWEIGAEMEDEDEGEFDNFGEEANAETFYQCWDIMKKHQGRWDNVEITVKHMVEDHPFRMFIKDAPLLQHLRMHFKLLNFESPLTTIDFASLPGLRMLDLRGPFEFKFKNAILGNLREVDISRTDRGSERPSVTDFNTLLAASPNLEKVTISLVGYDLGNNLTAVRLEHLHTLSINLSIVNGTSKAKLFRSLTLPRLSTFRVKVQGTDGPGMEILAMVLRSRANITDLELDGPGIHHQEVESFLEESPKLERLSLGSSMMTSSLMAGLTVGKKGSVKLCPLLRVLEVNDFSSLKPPQQAMFEKLVVSRWSKDKEGPRILTTVKIRFFHKSKPIGSEVSKCISAGLEFIEEKQRIDEIFF